VAHVFDARFGYAKSQGWRGCFGRALCVILQICQSIPQIFYRDRFPTVLAITLALRKSAA
jgi:hypothetical protein